MRATLGRVYHFYADVFHEWPSLFLVNLTVLLAEVAYFMVFATLPLYLTGQLGASAKAVGLVFSAFAIMETLGKTPAGVLSDHWGRLRVVLIGLCLCTLAPLLMSIATKWEHFVFIRVLDGLGLAAVWPSMIALINTRVPNTSRATALSTFNFAYIAGIGIGSFAGLELGERLGGGDNRQVFFVSAAVFVVTILSVGALSLAERGRRRAERISADKPPLLWDGIKEVVRSRRVLLHMLWIFTLLQLAITMLAPVLTLYARDVLGLGQHEMVKFMFVPVAAMVVLAVPLGRIADRIGRDRAAQFGIAGGGLALLCLPLFPGILAKQIIGVIWGCSYLIAAPAWLALASDLAPAGMQGATMGAMNTAQGVGFCAGPVVGALLYDIWPDGPFVAAASVLIIAALATFGLVRAPAAGSGGDSTAAMPVDPRAGR